MKKKKKKEQKCFEDLTCVGREGRKSRFDHKPHEGLQVTFDPITFPWSIHSPTLHNDYFSLPLSHETSSTIFPFHILS